MQENDVQTEFHQEQISINDVNSVQAQANEPQIKYLLQAMVGILT